MTDPGTSDERVMKPKRFGVEVVLPPKEMLNDPSVLTAIRSRAEVALLIKMNDERYYCPTPFVERRRQEFQTQQMSMVLEALAYPVRERTVLEALSAD